MVEARDSHTAEHSADVATLAQQMAQKLNCDPQEIHLIGVAARLHEIGKVAVPDAILNKRGQLTEDEWQVICEHPAIGADIVSRIPMLRATAPLIRAHHERYDGTGYPDQLAKEMIPLGARIICTADAYSAMITRRPYGDARPPSEALEEIQRGADTQFDPQVVSALSQALAEEQRTRRAA